MSATKYLDSTGLAYFWSKIKSALGLKADDSGVVHIAGTETITGAKTFTSNVVLKRSGPQFLCQDTRGVKGTAPSSNLWNQFFYVRDKNNVSYGGIEHGYKTTRENRINLIVYPGTTNTTSSNAQISVGFDTNGNWFTYSPTPAVADNSTKIATTAWARTATGNFACNAATASSAAKLTTARKINGVSFDGSADVTLTAVVSSASRSADIAANGTFTVPSYTVGKQQLLVYLDGCLSRQGDGWDEVGTAGTASTTIKFNQLIPADMEIVVRVN